MKTKDNLDGMCAKGYEEVRVGWDGRKLTWM